MGHGQRLQRWEGWEEPVPWVWLGQKCPEGAMKCDRRPKAGNSQWGPRAPAPRCGQGRAYLYHGRWVLKAWSHRWQGPAAGQSSSAPSVPGPRAHHACSSKRHSEGDLKGEARGRAARPWAPRLVQWASGDREDT